MNDFGLERLRAAVANASRRAPAVSDWSIGMHVHHCCLAAMGICHALETSAPPPPASRSSLVTSLVFMSGWIPRGRGRSPGAVLPSEDASRGELEALLDQSRELLDRAHELDPQSWFRHFAFGVLPRDKALKFIAIHNRHHLRIIADIAAA